MRTPVYPPEPAEKDDKDEPSAVTRRVSLRAQEKELRETVEQLLARVSELKVQLDKTPPAQVFSVTMFKQTQEIEKLAKKLKSCAKA